MTLAVCWPGPRCGPGERPALLDPRFRLALRSTGQPPGGDGIDRQRPVRAFCDEAKTQFGPAQAEGTSTTGKRESPDVQ